VYALKARKYYSRPLLLTSFYILHYLKNDSYLLFLQSIALVGGNVPKDVKGKIIWVGNRIKWVEYE
jgi:hypothetical protein